MHVGTDGICTLIWSRCTDVENTLFFFGAPYSVNLMFYFSNNYKKQADISSKMLEQRRRKDIIVGIYRKYTFWMYLLLPKCTNLSLVHI